MAFSTKDRHRLHEIADFLTWWILEKTRKWRPKDGGVVVGRAEFSQVSCVLRVCQLCKCFCPDEIRLVMAEAPGDRIQEYEARDHWDQENRSSPTVKAIPAGHWTSHCDLTTSKAYNSLSTCEMTTFNSESHLRVYDLRPLGPGKEILTH
ncbi:hypothetical protein Bbelb_127130 [Branchiostoma belcheri]|nr:hypothetical protein Bbelb_127130 [Branchiostoma belcheri]